MLLIPALLSRSVQLQQVLIAYPDKTGLNFFCLNFLDLSRSWWLYSILQDPDGVFSESLGKKLVCILFHYLKIFNLSKLT